MKHILNTIVLGTFVLAGCSNAETGGHVNVIPMPNKVSVGEEIVNTEKGIRITVTDKSLEDEAALFGTLLENTGCKLAENGVPVKLGIDPGIDNAEGYVIKASGRKISVKGKTDAGVFYGMQTLLHQLRSGGIRTGMIEDAPRYGWRGYMLDEARHFSGKERVKELLDLMAYYKMNRFHWHLTDAQGWRIEILGYPKLTETGAEGNHSDPEAPARFYTQEDIREIVAYASARHIEIIPEIDMPGHATAANRAYPEYNGGGSFQFPDFTFNVGKEGTYAFLTDILREVSGLFPYDYIHIGGDEVAYGSEAWLKDKDVVSMMEREGLETVKEAERYFMLRMADSVAVLGKKMIGWDEITDLGIDTAKTAVCWWRHDKPEYLDKALKMGYNTILCPRKPLYFDFVQHESHKWGRIWDGFCPLEDVYAFPDSHISEIPEAEKKHIMGMQANSWTELMHTKERVDFMTFPRLCALAESAWTEADVKNFGDFTERLEYSFRMFDEMGIYYFDTRNPENHPEPSGPEIKKLKMDFRD